MIQNKANELLGKKEALEVNLRLKYVYMNAYWKNIKLDCIP